MQPKCVRVLLLIILLIDWCIKCAKVEIQFEKMRKIAVQKEDICVHWLHTKLYLEIEFNVGLTTSGKDFAI
jgi:hypothetical protein